MGGGISPAVHRSSKNFGKCIFIIYETALVISDYVAMPGWGYASNPITLLLKTVEPCSYILEKTCEKYIHNRKKIYEPN